jgi:hypothetical protein
MFLFLGNEMERDSVLPGTQRDATHTQGGHKDDPTHGPTVPHSIVSIPKTGLEDIA